MGPTVHSDPFSTTLLLPQARSRGQESSGPSGAAAGVASAGTLRDGLWAGAAGGPGFLDVGGGVGAGLLSAFVLHTPLPGFLQSSVA